MLKQIATFGIATIVLGSTAPIGGRGVWLPSFPPTPLYYPLPMVISVVWDSSITTSTPITDAAGSDVIRWSELISECLQQSPVMMRQTVEGDVMFNVTDNDPMIVLNSNGKAVCAY